MVEKRLIDAKALIQDAEPYLTWDMLAAINNADTVDAVPVVRCRDCKHMIPQSHTRYCTVWNAVNGMRDDGFCNYGERKEGADNG